MIQATELGYGYDPPEGFNNAIKQRFLAKRNTFCSRFSNLHSNTIIFVNLVHYPVGYF